MDFDRIQITTLLWVNKWVCYIKKNKHFQQYKIQAQIQMRNIFMYPRIQKLNKNLSFSHELLLHVFLNHNTDDISVRPANIPRF